MEMDKDMNIWLTKALSNYIKNKFAIIRFISPTQNNKSNLRYVLLVEGHQECLNEKFTTDATHKK